MGHGRRLSGFCELASPPLVRASINQYTEHPRRLAGSRVFMHIAGERQVDRIQRKRPRVLDVRPRILESAPGIVHEQLTGENGVAFTKINVYE
jgi:hypothetical protein